MYGSGPTEYALREGEAFRACIMSIISRVLRGMEMGMEKEATASTALGYVLPAYVQHRLHRTMYITVCVYVRTVSLSVVAQPVERRHPEDEKVFFLFFFAFQGRNGMRNSLLPYGVYIYTYI